jgi:CheY-like chemotaxis protein
MGPNQPPPEQEIESINAAEVLLLKARAASRRAEERAWRLADKHGTAGPHPAGLPAGGAPPAGVLVAEDEPVVRDLLGLMLRGHGFRVWLAADGAEAVELYCRHRGSIHAVLLDCRMPVLDGPAALRALREVDPAVRCCFLTGYAGEWGAEELFRQGAAAVLEKPLDLPALTGVLRQLAEAPDASPSEGTHGPA